MNEIIKGQIFQLNPTFNAHINQNKVFEINENGDISLTVDTGFDGDIALPHRILNILDIELAGFQPFTLANGEIVDLELYFGRTIVNNNTIETWFIPGDNLIGMDFLSTVGNLLCFDFKKEIVKLTL